MGILAKLPVAALLLLLILCPQISQADEAGKSWSVEPFVDYGIVYESTEHITTYTGGGISARWMPGPWSVSARWRSDEYVITYYGVTKQTAQELFMNKTLSGPLLTPAQLRERKEDREIMVGRQAGSENLYLFVGMRQVRLINNFSGMNIFGPSISGEAAFDWGDKTVALTLDGVLDEHGTVRNHRDDYVLPDGEKTISFYGELRSVAGWSAMVCLQPGVWGRLQFGYEGSVMNFKYVYRYYHGLVLKLAF